MTYTSHACCDVRSLMVRANQLSGQTIETIAATQGWLIPQEKRRTKGWIGQLVEYYLGAKAGNLPMPDFPELGIELKTLPVNRAGIPQESTYVCTVPLLSAPSQSWENSLVWRKLQCVLWVPILALKGMPLAQHLIGTPFLWRPNKQEEELLRNDWEELMTRIHLGQLETIHASLGVCLQIRPKAANSRSLTLGRNEEGHKTPTLPRGFYLRASFTANIIRTRHGS